MAKITTIVINKGEKGDPGSGGGAGVAVQPGAPASPATGTLWFDTDDPAITPGEVTQHAYAEDHGVATANADNASALNTLLTSYKKVEFRSTGTFLAGSITIPAGTTLIVPDGVTLKAKNALNSTFVTVNGRLVGEGVIDGNKANQTGGVGVDLETTGARVHDVTIQNTYADGIYSNATGCRIRRVTVTGAGNFGIWDRLGQCLIDGCMVTNTTNSGIRTNGYTGFGNIRTKIVNNTVDETTSGAICIELWAEAANLAYGAAVTGNTTTGGLMGISLDHQYNAACTGNTVRGCTQTGIELASAVDCAVTGNTVDGQGALTGCIGCSNTNNGHNTITGNTLLGFTGSGVQIFQGAQYSVCGNIIDGPGGGGGNGVWVQDANNVTISGNTVTNTNNPWTVENASGVTITGNTVIGAGAVVTFNLSTAGTYDYITITGNVYRSTTFGVYQPGTTGTLGPHVVIKANVCDYSGGLPDYLDYANNVIDLTGTGTPEGVVTAGIGSVFRRRDGTTGTTLYKKQTGTGNTGWVAS